MQKKETIELQMEVMIKRKSTKSETLPFFNIIMLEYIIDITS